MSSPTAKEINSALIDMFESGMKKEAQDAVTDFVRMRMREEVHQPEQAPIPDFDPLELDP